MTMRPRTTDNAAITRLGEQRRELLSRAVLALESDCEIPIDVHPETLRKTTALLAASLEELRVAEEELLQQNEELIATREAIDARTREFQRLFDDAPLPYVVTDSCGTIRHANRAAAVLLKRPAELLERKPLLGFVPLERRSAFRDALNRLPLVDAAHDWRVTMLRHGDSPVDLAIDVAVSTGGATEEMLLCWVLRPSAPRSEAS